MMWRKILMVLGAVALITVAYVTAFAVEEVHQPVVGDRTAGGAAEATTWTVCSSGCDFTSIQAAVDAAGSGDTIELGPENFDGLVDGGAKHLKFVGAGPSKTGIGGWVGGRSAEFSDLSLRGIWGLGFDELVIDRCAIGCEPVITTDTVDCLDPPEGGIGFSGTVYAFGFDWYGGLYSSRVTITDSTLSGNFALGFDQARIENSTFLRPVNQPDINGPLWVSGNRIDISASTVSGVSASISLGGPDVTVSHSILAAHCFVGDGVTSGGYNLATDDSCSFLTDPTDQTNVDPMLLPLADNGGPTPTLALAVGSPAIDAGGSDCLATDQRGVARPQDGDGDGVARCDIGAYEFEIPVIAVELDIKPDGYPNSVNPYSRGVIPVAILGSDTFDVADIDVTTLAFGPSGAPIAHLNGHLEDVNYDGITDLMLHFRTQDTGIVCGDESATLTGETLDGQPIEGTDTIETVGCRETRRPLVLRGEGDRVVQPRPEGPVNIERK